MIFRYGEIVDVNLVRDKGTGKSKGFAFVAYEDQRSTNLAVGWFLSICLSQFCDTFFFKQWLLQEIRKVTAHYKSDH